MLKKLALVALLALGSSAAFASNFDGAYVGAGVGVDRTEIKAKNEINGRKASDKKSGYLASVFAGYGKTFSNSLYLGAELNVDGVSTEIKDHDLSLKVNRVYGLSILPGFVVSDTTLVYARIGVVKAHYAVKGYDLDKTGDVNGNRYGVGITQNINPNLNLRVEYSRINYSSFSSKIDSIKFTPKTDRLELGLSYNFG